MGTVYKASLHKHFSGNSITFINLKIFKKTPL